MFSKEEARLKIKELTEVLMRLEWPGKREVMEPRMDTNYYLQTDEIQ